MDTTPPAELLVTLKRTTEQVADIVRILSDLDVAILECETPAAAADAGRVVLRIPGDRTFAAVLALAHHGFVHVRVYGER